MDEVRAFLNNPCPSKDQVIKLKGPLTDGVRITKNDTINESKKNLRHRQSAAATDNSADYAERIKREANDQFVKNEKTRDRVSSVSKELDDVEKLSEKKSTYQSSEANTKPLTDEAMTKMYKKYTFQMKENTNNNLTINEEKSEVLKRIGIAPVVIVEGPTGCGKTTQVPQWILDYSYKERKPCKIVVTQPRRIAAISIAKRVAQERGWDVGGVVGYQVGLDNKTSNDTCIHYVTTGVLLQKLVAAQSLNEYTHIILDEVHERGQEMDFLLLIVKKLLFTKSPTVKIVLMSATFNKMAFAKYFAMPTPNGMLDAYHISVDSAASVFTVNTFYLNNLNKFGAVLQQATPRDEPGINPEMYHLVIKLVNAFEIMDVHEEKFEDRSQADLPSVLIFLPGINEIEDLYECLTDIQLRKKIANAECAKYNWWVLPLHSTITVNEQARVFQRAPPGHRKIILATNIAESSITVPDIKYVIDFCLMKLLVADPNTNFTSLQLTWASKANCEQRAGRAGRVRDGRVYRLVSEAFYNNLPEECKPEIVRSPLERLVLLAKMLNMGSPSEVLSLAMDPPEVRNIHRTVLVLKEIGALKKNNKGKWDERDGDITHMGRIMAKLPLDVRVSKSIILGHIFGCLEETIIMAAAISVKSVFSSPFRERLNAYNSKLTWADGSTSDCIALLNVYKVWHHLRQQKYFKQSGGGESQWARRFYVQARALREVDDLVRELRIRLSREGLESRAAPSPWTKSELPLALKVILAGAFYPQYFVQISQDEDREREAVRTLGGLNPRHTVYLKNFPDHQPREVYASAIRKAIQQHIGEEPRVTFDKNSCKVFLTFSDNEDLARRDKANSGDPTIPGQVMLAVYKAVKARQLRMDVRMPLLPVEKAKALAAVLETTKASERANLENMVPRLPDIDNTHFPLKISQILTVSKFWAQYDDESTASELATIQSQLNKGSLLAVTDTVQPGNLLAAPYTDADGTTIHRVRVMKVLPRDMVEVLYIDYGSMGRVSLCNLRVLPLGQCRTTPPLAMRCILAEIAPSPLLEPHGQWTRNAQALFQNIVRKGRLFGKVYSVAHGVVSIELLAEGGRLNLNQELLKNGFAIQREESYESKTNHDLRESATELNLSQKRAFNREQAELAFCELREIDPPAPRDCEADVHLKGPFSPLESSLHTLIYGSRDKQVHIEWNSVNAVLLDTDPQDVYQRLLVAGVVGQNELGTQLTLRHTTLLPNLPGLPGIIALLFCPSALVRRDKNCTRYVSALCGLGSIDEMPLFSDHDLLIDIDTDLNVTDLGDINHIRHLMDYVLRCDEQQAAAALEDDFRARAPGLIRETLLKLVLKRRGRYEPETKAHAWDWTPEDPNDALEITEPAMQSPDNVFPLHTPYGLRPPNREHLLKLKRANEELKILVTRTSTTSTQSMSCELCTTPPMSLHAMRIHLYSNSHKQKEEDLSDLQT